MATVFLSYAREDASAVQAIYSSLRVAGLNPWMDQPPSPYQRDGIPPGAEWDMLIRTHLNECQLALAFFSSRSVLKEGYVQRELRLLLNRHMNQPAGKVFLLPVLLEPCTPPNIRVDTFQLSDIHWYELFTRGIDDLLAFISTTLAGRDVTIKPPPLSAGEASMQTQIELLQADVRDRELKQLELIKHYESRISVLDRQNGDLQDNQPSYYEQGIQDRMSH